MKLRPCEQKRRLTVVTRHREHGRVPEIRLGGMWLVRAGFLAGARLDAAVAPSRLVITVSEVPARHPLLDELLEEARRLARRGGSWPEQGRSARRQHARRPRPPSDSASSGNRSKIALENP